MTLPHYQTIAIIVPAYCEQDSIQIFFSTLKEALKSEDKYVFRIIFVDDGSVDQTALKIDELVKQNNGVERISFTRNFGKEVALTAGIRESYPNFAAAITIDADLQHPPSLIPQFLREWEAGYKVVTGIRTTVDGHTIFRRLGSWAYYQLINRIGGSHLTPNGTDFKLIDHQVASEFLKLNEEIFIYRGVVDWFGFEEAKIEFSAPERYFGQPRYSYASLFRTAINSITRFSLLPLKFTGYLGIFITLTSSICLFFIFISSIFLERTIAGPLATVVIFNTLLVGILMICLGLIAIYIANIRSEVLKRPRYVIKSKCGPTQ